jgi:Asp-tRNA(Asn)/Glu-tRNA(Gln) amidotransferase A subunit family amidase
MTVVLNSTEQSGLGVALPVTAASEGQVRSYLDNVDAASLNGVRLGVVREFMRVHTKADEDAVAVVENALRDLTRAGATLVDPGPEGALFTDALAEILPALDAGTLAAVFKEAFPPGTDLVAASIGIAGKCQEAAARSYPPPHRRARAVDPG